MMNKCLFLLCKSSTVFFHRPLRVSNTNAIHLHSELNRSLKLLKYNQSNFLLKRNKISLKSTIAGSYDLSGVKIQMVMHLCVHVSYGRLTKPCICLFCCI